MLSGLVRIRPGFLGVAASVTGLRRLTLPQPTREAALAKLRTELPAGDSGDSDAFLSLKERLEGYFAGEAVDFSDVELDLEGRTPFQRQVLEAVRSIPRGEVRTYRDVAASFGRPLAARAVGGVMAANPVCVIIPCHRVLASDGTLGGFGGGLDMKRRMLELEGISQTSPTALKQEVR